MRLAALLAAALALPALTLPAAAQVHQPQHHPMPAATRAPHPTKVVARSDRLVTARTSNGGTQSFNCRAPRNARKPVCRGAR